MPLQSFESVQNFKYKTSVDRSWREEWGEEKWACTRAIDFWIPRVRWRTQRSDWLKLTDYRNQCKLTVFHITRTFSSPHSSRRVSRFSVLCRLCPRYPTQTSEPARRLQITEPISAWKVYFLELLQGHLRCPISNEKELWHNTKTMIFSDFWNNKAWMNNIQ